uniref:Venom protein n=1 Tax=Hadrurus spadix TaxID=141984 RepID=A0A1W7R946_9SCOR
MDSKFIIFLTTFNVLLCVCCSEEGSLQNMIQRWKERSYIKEILRRLDDRIEQLGQDYRKAKRPCLLNLPGSDCDSMDTLGVAKDQGHWADETGPGKKRRRRACPLNLPGSGCEHPDAVGLGRDVKYWNSAESPGRKRNIPVFDSYDEE